MPLPPTTLFLWDQISDTTKLYPSREGTPFMRPLFHCRKGGLTRGGMLSFNSNMTGTTSGAGTLYSSWTLEFTPSLSLIVTWFVPLVEQELFLNRWVHSQSKSCCSIFSFQCSVLWTTVCLFALPLFFQITPLDTYLHIYLENQLRCPSKGFWTFKVEDFLTFFSSKN
jgi:hypothetical protein